MFPKEQIRAQKCVCTVGEFELKVCTYPFESFFLQKYYTFLFCKWSIEGTNVPYKELADGKGWIKVIVGSFEELNSVIPNYSKQFLYHIHLEPNGSFTTEFADNLEVAAYLPVLPAFINEESFNAGDFIEFDRKAGTIELRNDNQEAYDLLLFGGEPYKEPIVAEGPFVMNSRLEIANAYRDFYNNDYGKIDYQKQRAKA